jgi:hypothetical protein
MNAEQQRARFSYAQRAEARLEKRLEDLELVVETMAVETVKGGTAHNQQIEALGAAVNTALDEALERHIALAESFLAFEHRTLWQRLRWLVRGA